jgi:hypothetical protein
MEQLVEACVKFYHSRLEKAADSPRVHQRREQLSRWVWKFHEDCGTLTPQVEESIDNLRKGSCLFLMTAHQPNLFAYGGVLRKATLINAVAEKLTEKLNLPVVSFFGLADQDFTDDRWVKSALLPHVERRDGVVDIRLDLPEKTMLKDVEKPSREVLDGWRNSIEDWLEQNFRLVERSLKPLGIRADEQKETLINNLGKFWNIVEDAYSRAKVYSDFTAFIMSRIVNGVWEYCTLFSRFSECQQAFESEFCMILSRFGEYSTCVKEATLSSQNSQNGVCEREYNSVPFWYHCSCGSKAKLLAEQGKDGLIGHGSCLRCGKEYQMGLVSENGADISGIRSRISARSISMPLVFFEGLGVSCYVGGVGGRKYMEQAHYVAEHMGTTFPPVAIWRPKDVYSGIGQLAALFTFGRISNTLDLSEYHKVRARLESQIASVRKNVEELEARKKQRTTDVKVKREEAIENVKAFSAFQDQLRRDVNFSSLVRDLKLLKHVETVMSLHPCIIDYAVNIGLKETSQQWTAFLRKNGNFLSDINLRTSLEFPIRIS